MYTFLVAWLQSKLTVMWDKPNALAKATKIQWKKWYSLKRIVSHYHIAGNLGGGKFGELTLSSIWQKKVWWINRLAINVLRLHHVVVSFKVVAT